MLEGFRQQRVAVSPGIEINCMVGGAGPARLLLHGVPQNLFMWAQVAPLLAQDHTVVCADLRGYGDSSKPVAAEDLSTYSFRAMAADQVALMRALGFDRFHLIGHDRGARTGHRMALDHPDAVASLALLDIVPTHAMFSEVNRHVARAYWHWYFLQQPYPYPEQVIAANPDHFYEGCLVGWGATGLGAFDAGQLDAYRRGWRSAEAIHGSCSDYRAAASVDFALDGAHLGRTVGCPTLVFSGSAGLMHRLFDMGRVWSSRLSRMATASLPGGHFFVDQFGAETARILARFVGDTRRDRLETVYVP